MSKVFIIDAATAQKEDITSLSKDPKFRKATKSMKMATLASQQVLKPYQDLLEKHPGALGLFLGTGHGEMEATRDFLKRYKGSGTGAPIFFQNSLHNSTTGFLTQYLGIYGASLTSTNGHFSGENALDLATLALRQKQVSIALVIGVDSLVYGLEEALHRMYPSGLSLGEGAGAILLCNNDGLQLLQPDRHWGSIQKLDYCHQATPLPPKSLAELQGHYDANFISLLAVNLLQGNQVPNMTFKKPDGTHSKITLDFEWENY